MKHWPHPTSRCPECGYKQGDINPNIQPCRLSTANAELLNAAETVMEYGLDATFANKGDKVGRVRIVSGRSLLRDAIKQAKDL